MGEPSSRKWLITINNPQEHGYDHDKIRNILQSIKGATVYWCFCDEIGDECETLHTHIFLFRQGAFRASVIDKLFPKMHRDIANGKTQECRAYVLKDGEKFHKDETGHYLYTDSSGKVHEGTNFSDTFEEFGDCPQEHQGKSTQSERVLELLQAGASNREIVFAIPDTYKQIDKIERTRSMLRDADFAENWRDLETTYIFGTSGSGKTRSVMDRYGYRNCYRVTDYKHPFDTYDGQDVIIFEEFRGNLRHGDMLNYLDGYPLLLPCRYFNRQACYTKVYIITNIPPDKQYENVDRESVKAFYRRIHKVQQYTPLGVMEWNGVDEYLHRHDWIDDAESAPSLI